MVQCCAVVGCKANSRKNHEVRFYCFPSDKNPDIRKEWVARLNRHLQDGTVWEPKYFHKVCSRHFKEGRPTPDHPYPDQNLSPDGLDKADPVPVSPRRRARFTAPTTPGSSDTKVSPEGKRKISPKSEPESHSKSSIPQDNSSPGVTLSKRRRGSEDSAIPHNSPDPDKDEGSQDKSDKGESDPASQESALRSSCRKRKRRVFNTPSDEEVIDNLVEEPETYTIWRRRQSAVAEPEIEPELRSTGYRMRSRRSVEDHPAPSTEEVEPEVFPAGKKKRLIVKDEDGEEEEKDSFCWICHKEGTDLACELCPRGFHLKCLDMHQACPSWVCTECEKIMRAECVDTRSPSMALLTLDQLCVILRFALSQMRISGSEPFFHPVDKVALPLYEDFIANPTDFSTLEKNIRRKVYGSTEAFLADVRWLPHNSIVFNGSTHKLTTVARAIVRICKQEISDIEGCPDCYTNAWIKQDKNWFVEPCRIPHTLVWAKLKGYPYWPGKILSVRYQVQSKSVEGRRRTPPKANDRKALNEEGGQTDIRFFGAHDRAWVPTSNVLMLSREPLSDLKSRRLGMDKAMEELVIHIKKLEEKFGSFKYSAPNVPYDPHISYGHMVKSAVFKKAENEIKKEVKSEYAATSETDVKPGKSFQIHANTDKKDAVSVDNGSIKSENIVLEEDVKAHSSAGVPEESNDSTTGKPDASSHNSRPSTDDISMDTSTTGEDQPAPESSPKAPDSPPPAKDDSDDSRLAGLSIIERLELKMLEADREEAELQAKEQAALEKTKAPTLESDGQSSKTTSVENESKAFSGTANSEGEQEKTGKVVQEESAPGLDFSPPEGDREYSPPAEIDLSNVSLIGAPRRNPMLDNLVNSCKAKLGIENDEDELKLESSLSFEAEDGEEGTSSSSPRTVSSLQTRHDDDDDEDEDDEEEENEDGDEDENDEDEDDSGETDEEEEDEEEEAEKQDVKSKSDKIGDEKTDNDSAPGLPVESSTSITGSESMPTVDGGEDTAGNAFDNDSAPGLPVESSITGSESMPTVDGEDTAGNEGEVEKHGADPDNPPAEMSSVKKSSEEKEPAFHASPNNESTGDRFEADSVAPKIVVSSVQTLSEMKDSRVKTKESESPETPYLNLAPSQLDENDESDTMPQIEVINCQSISPDDFAAVPDNAINKGVTPDIVEENEMSKTLRPSDGTPSQGRPDVHEDMEVDGVNTLKSIEQEKCEDPERDNSEDSDKTWPQSQSATLEGVTNAAGYTPMSIQAVRTESASTSPSCQDGLNITPSKAQKTFPSRLLEELVKRNCQTQAGETCATGAHVPPAVENDEETDDNVPASLNFQQSIREESFTTESMVTDPSQSKDSVPDGYSATNQNKDADGDLNPLDISDPLPRNISSGQIPIDLVTAGTSDIQPSFSTEPANKSCGVNIEKYVNKAMGAVQSVFKEMLNDVIAAGVAQDSVKRLREDMSGMKWYHEQEILEMQHNANLTMAEMRLTLEHEHTSKMKKLIQLHEEEREKTVEDVKKKQWCACCAKEANFYCCWNTSYCDYPCQQKHWSKHMPYCMQTQTTQTQVQDSPLSAPFVVPSNHTVLATTKSVASTGCSTDQNAWEVSPKDPQIQRRYRGDNTLPPGVQFVQQANTSSATVKPSAITVSKTLKLGTSGGSMALQYMPPQIGGASTEPGGPRLASQGPASAGGVPVMYQFLPRFSQTTSQNIRIVSTQPVPPRPATSQPVVPSPRHPSPVKSFVNIKPDNT